MRHQTSFLGCWITDIYSFHKYNIMNKYTEILGVDISKETFDVVDIKGNHKQYKNETKGFSKFAGILDDQSLVVMEATGYYHYLLAQFLSKSGIPCAVVNPLSIKRFVHLSPTSTLSRKRNERKTHWPRSKPIRQTPLPSVPMPRSMM